MKITIFNMWLRLKRWFGYVEFLGRVRRTAAKRLTLPDLEREVRVLTGTVPTFSGRPLKRPRFLALRYAFFGDRGLKPWVTHEAVLARYSKYHGGKELGFSFIFVPYTFLTLTSICVLLMLLAGMGSSRGSILVIALTAVCGFLATFLALGERFDLARQCLKATAQGTANIDSVTTVSTSAAIAQYVADRLEAVKEGLVGQKTVHATTRARADRELQEARAKWVQLHLRIRERYGDGVSDDASVELTDERVPSHLCVTREELRLILRRAQDTLNRLNEFESNLVAALDELGAEARAELVIVEDLDLIESVRALGGRVQQTALDARRSIERSLASLQERMDALRTDVLRREELISSVVAALPDAPNRDAQWQRLEDAVSGLSAPPRQRTLA